MQGTWADLEGIHTYVGDMSVPIIDQPFGDVLKFLEDFNFRDQETTNLPSSAGSPASERTFKHRDGRTVRLTQRFGSFNIPTIASISGSDGDEANSPFPMEVVGDLVKFVVGGRTADAPDKPAIMDRTTDEVSSAIGSVYGKVEAVNIPSAYAKAFRKVGLALKAGPTPGLQPVGVAQAQPAREDSSESLTYAGQAQDPTAGGQMHMEQPQIKGSFEEAMQSPAYTSDDGLDLWNVYKEGDLEPPDEVSITLDPMTGEVMFVSYEYEGATQLPFMGTPAMPHSPFADSPPPTPMTEAPQKQTNDVSNAVSGQRPPGQSSGDIGQPHAQPQIQAPEQPPHPPSAGQAQPQQPQQGQQPQQAGPKPGSPEWSAQTPDVPTWTSPDPTGSEENQDRPAPNIQLQRAFRKFAQFSKATHEHYAGELPTVGENSKDAQQRLESRGYSGSHFPSSGRHIYTHNQTGCHIGWKDTPDGKVTESEHFSMRPVIPRFRQ